MDRFKQGQESFRDTVIAYIIGFQNDLYWREGEGRNALQELLEAIIERHGSIVQEFKS